MIYGDASVEPNQSSLVIKSVATQPLQMRKSHTSDFTLMHSDAIDPTPQNRDSQVLQTIKQEEETSKKKESNVNVVLKLYDEQPASLEIAGKSKEGFSNAV